MQRPRFRDQVLQAREEAIMASVNRLLSDKGFEAMTVDEVVAEVGIAKASLYKHFTSKEELAAAAMVRVLDRAIEEARRLQAEPLEPRAQLEALVRWTYAEQLGGRMPALPSQNSSLRAALLVDAAYMDRLNTLSDLLGTWIEAAQQRGQLDAGLPSELVLYTLFARACDPVLGVMRATGAYTDAQIVDWLVRTCLRGLGA
ncbi:helix-turn-helix domain-containing protein [Pelomonas sp. APW6]|uniref:Helix-turn-helix domain-containing protein n=1 Tax=Roseateles subflavus TaxID=3053353 RepID=A0ABT7LFE1_9BURK|nr:TetR/AcrR family transcriptional regulator [Pelomonas sp. APW6]MDL5031558.1 helix-turn-helix domain-containing protein [Pelomonas sp. APW6]